MSEPVRIAMWSGPRNISTALMRAWENRDDCRVVDEPFYACYLHATGLQHPMRDEVLTSQPREWRAVMDQLTAPLPEGIRLQYQKQMAHHLLIPLDEEWLATARHAFLIRDPFEIVASYARKRGDPTADDLGLEKEREIYERVAEIGGREPAVIDAGDVLRQPEAALRRLCHALDVPFSEQMLSWPPGLRDSDGVWARHWYGAVARSTSFERYEPAPVDLPEHLVAVAESCMPHYEFLRSRKLDI